MGIFLDKQGGITMAISRYWQVLIAISDSAAIGKLEEFSKGKGNEFYRHSDQTVRSKLMAAFYINACNEGAASALYRDIKSLAPHASMVAQEKGHVRTPRYL